MEESEETLPDFEGVVKVIKRDGEMVDGEIVAPTELVRGPA